MLALRVSYVGELGWELHHPIETQRALYDALFAAGEDLGLTDFGYRALESMRFEKCYRLWGADMSADWSPLQAGLERFVAFDKGDFIGRDALLREREQGRRTRSRASSSTSTASTPTGSSRSTPTATTDRVRRLGRLRTHDRALDRTRVPAGRARRGGHRADRRHPRRPPPRRRLRAAAARPRRGAPLRLAIARARLPAREDTRVDEGTLLLLVGAVLSASIVVGVRRRAHGAARARRVPRARDAARVGRPGRHRVRRCRARARGRHHRPRADPLRGRPPDLVAAAARRSWCRRRCSAPSAWS